MLAQNAKIRVKLIARGQNSFPWRRQLPSADDGWGDCQFIFDKEALEYDFLVVIDDVSRRINSPAERLACADEHTLLVTSEPPTITRYGKAFTRQFHAVLTTHPDKDLPHPNRIYSQTGNLWFNGHTFNELESRSFQPKSELLSTVCSSKQQQHTLHAQRLGFTEAACKQLPQLHRFGHGYKPLQDKYAALDPYRYHLAIENYVGLHHWTEKFADPVLSAAIPVYFGCPNISDYFPEEAFFKIDIEKPDDAIALLNELLQDPTVYAKRLPALMEARRRLLYDYNLMALIRRHVCQTFNPGLKASRRALYGRKQMRLLKPLDFADHCKWYLQRFF